MIRPFTCLCFLLAGGSGLYLYQSKHSVQMLDRKIEQTVRDAEKVRDQARLLNAEWMLLNDPERLRALADQLLTLQTVKPTQFTTMADLDHRLPPVRSPDAPLEPVPEPAVMPPMVPPPVAQAQPPGTPAPAPLQAAAPPATQPAAPPATAKTVPAPSAPRPAAPLVAERRPPQRNLTAQAEPRPTTEPRPPAETRAQLIAAATPRPAPRIIAPVAPIAATLPGGSALGMAAHSSLPPPVPIPAGQKAIGLFPPLDH